MGAVEIRNLTKCYGRVTAVDGVSLDIEEGAIFGLLGRADQRRNKDRHQHHRTYAQFHPLFSSKRDGAYTSGDIHRSGQLLNRRSDTMRVSCQKSRARVQDALSRWRTTN